MNAKELQGEINVWMPGNLPEAWVVTLLNWVWMENRSLPVLYHGDLEQDYIKLFLVIKGFNAELDGTADQSLKLGNVFRFLIE
jgi:hypothetical protein